MGLHFVQVEREFIDGPGPSNIGMALELDDDAIIGKAARIWGWSLENASPDGVVRGAGAVRAIERAAGWSGAPGAFVAAFIDAGVLEPVKGGVRFRGWTDRYGKTLNRQDKDRDRKKKRGTSSGIPVEPPQESFSRVRPPPEVNQTRDSRPETGDGRPETSDSKPPPPVAAVENSAAPGFSVTPEVGEPEEYPPTGDGCWRWMQSIRRELGLSEEPTPPKGFSGWHDDALVKHGPSGIATAYTKYLRDKHFRDRDWPTAVFITDGVFRVRVPARAAG